MIGGGGGGFRKTSDHNVERVGLWIDRSSGGRLSGPVASDIQIP